MHVLIHKTSRYVTGASRSPKIYLADFFSFFGADLFVDHVKISVTRLAEISPFGEKFSQIYIGKGFIYFLFVTKL
jgi:hypothetical protein